MPRHTEFEIENDAKQPKENFMFKEPIVLLTIIWLSLSRGITLAVQSLWIKEGFRSGLFEIWSISLTAAPMVGIIFFAFLSELHGRKPTLIIIYSLSIVCCILNSFPWQASVTFSFPIQGVVNGGSFVMRNLAITEYCSPKHRLTYLLADSLLLQTAYSLTYILFTMAARSYPYVQAFQIVLGLACLVSACKWPESPYWLASNGKLEDSREAFLWLRGEEGGKELRSVMKERRSPGPFKLYWISLFVTIATISVAMFTDVAGRFWLRDIPRPKDKIVENIIRICSSIVIASAVAVVSYFVRRNVLFLLVTGISVVFSYGVAIWMYVDPTVIDPSHQLFVFVGFACDMLSKCGPAILGIILCIEIIPLKYNTHMACVLLLCYYTYYFPFMALFWGSFVDFESSNIYLLIFTTLSLGGVVVYYFFAPETKGKTLLEIQNMYTPELSDANSKEDHVVMTHM